MEETLCPKCGFAPIPSGAEACPRCHEPFSFLEESKKGRGASIVSLIEGQKSERTVLGGGIFGEVSAFPLLPGIAFGTGAVLWALRGSGVLLDRGEPAWLIAIAVLDLVVAVMLLKSLGPAKLTAQVVALAQLGLAAWFSSGELKNPVHAFFVAHAVALLASVTGEPGLGRRIAAMATASASAGAALLALAMAGQGPPPTALGGPQQGYQLRLPPGYLALTREELPSSLRVPADAVAFGNPGEHVYGMLAVRAAQEPLIGGCEALRAALGSAGAARPLEGAAPSSLGSEAIVYAISTSGGQAGRLACAKRGDGRLVGLAVLGAGADQAFERVAASLTLP